MEAEDWYLREDYRFSLRPDWSRLLDKRGEFIMRDVLHNKKIVKERPVHWWLWALLVLVFIPGLAGRCGSGILAGQCRDTHSGRSCDDEKSISDARYSPAQPDPL